MAATAAVRWRLWFTLARTGHWSGCKSLRSAGARRLSSRTRGWCLWFLRRAWRGCIGGLFGGQLFRAVSASARQPPTRIRTIKSKWQGARRGRYSYVRITRWSDVLYSNRYIALPAESTLSAAGVAEFHIETLHAEDLLLKICLRRGLPLDLLDADWQERASVSVADDVLEPKGHRPVLTDPYRLLADAVVRMVQFELFMQRGRASCRLNRTTLSLLAKLPGTCHPLDVVRTGISYMGSDDFDEDSSGVSANYAKSLRMFAALPAIVVADTRRRRGLEPIALHSDMNYAQNVLHMCFGDVPEQVVVDASDEHGFATSIAAARVVTSTLPHIDSAVTAAIGALKGPLYGDVNKAVMTTCSKSV